MPVLCESVNHEELKRQKLTTDMNEIVKTVQMK